MAAGIPASSERRRAFVVVGARRDVGRPGGARVSQILNAEQPDMRFSLRRYEIDKDLLASGRYPAEDDLHDSVHSKGIASGEALERELARHLHDLSVLGGTHDNPV